MLSQPFWLPQSIIFKREKLVQAICVKKNVGFIWMFMNHFLFKFGLIISTIELSSSKAV